MFIGHLCVLNTCLSHLLSHLVSPVTVQNRCHCLHLIDKENLRFWEVTSRLHSYSTRIQIQYDWLHNPALYMCTLSPSAQSASDHSVKETRLRKACNASQRTAVKRSWVKSCLRKIHLTVVLRADLSKTGKPKRLAHGMLKQPWR